MNAKRARKLSNNNSITINRGEQLRKAKTNRQKFKIIMDCIKDNVNSDEKVGFIIFYINEYFEYGKIIDRLKKKGYMAQCFIGKDFKYNLAITWTPEIMCKDKLFTILEEYKSDFGIIGYYVR